MTDLSMLKQTLTSYQEYQVEYATKAKSYRNYAKQMQDTADKYQKEINRVARLIKDAKDENNS